MPICRTLAAESKRGSSAALTTSMAFCTRIASCKMLRLIKKAGSGEEAGSRGEQGAGSREQGVGRPPLLGARCSLLLAPCSPLPGCSTAAQSRRWPHRPCRPRRGGPADARRQGPRHVATYHPSSRYPSRISPAALNMLRTGSCDARSKRLCSGASPGLPVSWLPRRPCAFPPSSVVPGRSVPGSLESSQRLMLATTLVGPDSSLRIRLRRRRIRKFSKALNSGN